MVLLAPISRPHFRCTVQNYACSLHDVRYQPHHLLFQMQQVCFPERLLTVAEVWFGQANKPLPASLTVMGAFSFTSWMRGGVPILWGQGVDTWSAVGEFLRFLLLSSPPPFCPDDAQQSIVGAPCGGTERRVCLENDCCDRWWSAGRL